MPYIIGRTDRFLRIGVAATPRHSSAVTTTDCPLSIASGALHVKRLLKSPVCQIQLRESAAVDQLDESSLTITRDKPFVVTAREAAVPL